MKKFYAMTFGHDESSGRYYFEVETNDISERGLIECDGIGVHFEEHEPEFLTPIIAFELEFESDENGEWIPTNFDAKELTQEQFQKIENIFDLTAESIAKTGYIKSSLDIENVQLSDVKWDVEHQKPGWELAKKVADILENAFGKIEDAENGTFD
jgi:hypothetical protein